MQKKLQLYRSFRDEIVIIDGITMKGKRVIEPASPQNEALNQLHLNDMGIEKMYVLGHEDIYWVNMNVNTEDKIKNCPTCPDFKATQSKEKKSHGILEGLENLSQLTFFAINSKHYLCIVDYHNKFLVIKQVGASVDITQ